MTDTTMTFADLTEEELELLIGLLMVAVNADNVYSADEAVQLKLIATDGVFSMDGIIAPLKEICDLADQYDAMVMVDDSHATGFVGKTGRGTPEHCGVEGRVDIITSTLGKAMGGATGGYTSGRKEIVELLRQRSRPYLFSNSLAPVVVAAALKAPAPEHPSAPAAVYEEFLARILPYNLHTNHPRFWAWYMGSGNVMGALADFLAAALNPNVGGISHVAPLVIG